MLDWAGAELGIRLKPTESIFGATLGEEVLAAVERHLQVSACCGAVLCWALPSASWQGRVEGCWTGCAAGIRKLLHNCPWPATTHPRTSLAQGLDRWHLAAAEQLAACCKSVLLGLAVTAGKLSIEQTLEAARLEEDHQIERWGLVEGGHDIDIADLRVRVAAPSLFIRLLNRH